MNGIPLSPSLSPEERKSLEGQLVKAQLHVADIARRLNAATPATRLPEELLVEIFKWHIKISSEPKSRISRRHFSQTYGWILSTHVCHHWREIALKTPALWTRIEVTKLDCIQTFLERSRSQPLDVHGLIPTSPQDGFRLWEPMFQQAARIEQLAIEYREEPSRRFRNKLENFLRSTPKEFRVLKKLKVDVYDGDITQLSSLLETLGGYSALESINCVGVPLPVVAPVCPSGLKHLSLIDFGPSVGRNETWTTLFTTLKSVPQLETLTLQDCFPRSPPGDFFPDAPPTIVTPPVALPHLRTLHVLCNRPGRAPIISTFLANIAPSPNASLRVLVSGGGHILTPAADDLSITGKAVGRFLASAAQRDTSAVLRTLCLQRGDPEEDRADIILFGWRAVPPSPEPALHLIPDVLARTPPALEVLLRGYRPVAGKTIDEFLPRLPLEGVQMLVLDDFAEGYERAEGPHVPTAQLWWGAFRRAGDVRVLCLAHTCAVDLPQALRPRAADQAVLFPKLEALKLVDVAFVEERVDDNGNDVWVRGEWFASFVGALQARTGLNPELRLEKLYITKANCVTVDEVEELRKCVGEVVWDGLRGDERVWIDDLDEEGDAGGNV